MIFLLTTLCFLVSFEAFAQQDTLHRNYKNYYALSLGFGKANENYNIGTSSISIQRKNNYISIGVASISKPEFIFLNDQPNPSTSGVNLLVGKSFTFNRYLNIQIGAGVSYVEDISRGAFLYNSCKSYFCIIDHNVYETVNRKVIGLPIEFKTNIYLDRTASLTIGTFANLNATKSFYGIYAGVTVGRLRDKITKG